LKSTTKKTLSFYLLSFLFCAFVLFLYGPMLVVFTLSFQGPNGGLTFPMQSVSIKWFSELFSPGRSGDIAGPLARSLTLSLIVASITIVFSFFAGLAFRRKFKGSGVVFYFVIASLIMPGLLVGLGISLSFRVLGLSNDWLTSGLGAQLSWTLPFGLLIMFAVLGRFDRSIDEAAFDLGANDSQRMRYITLPILLPGIIGIALFGFTLSYDEFPRTLMTVGSKNTLPLEVWAMTTNVTTPVLYALGTMTSLISFGAMILVIFSLYLIKKRRAA
jgi:putative spermidine/putrescine transport system permease protein